MVGTWLFLRADHCADPAFLRFWIGTNFNSFLLGFQDKNGFTFNYFKLSFHEVFSAKTNLRQGVLNTLLIFLLNNAVIFPASIIFSYFLYKK